MAGRGIYRSRPGVQLFDPETVAGFRLPYIRKNQIQDPIFQNSRRYSLRFRNMSMERHAMMLLYTSGILNSIMVFFL